MALPLSAKTAAPHEAIASALRTLETEGSGIDALRAALRNGLSEGFLAAVGLIRTVEGRVIVTGMGKSGHVGTKIAQLRFDVPEPLIHGIEPLIHVRVDGLEPLVHVRADAFEMPVDLLEPHAHHLAESGHVRPEPDGRHTEFLAQVVALEVQRGLEVGHVTMKARLEGGHVDPKAGDRLTVGHCLGV